MQELKLEDILSQTSDLNVVKKVWYVAVIGRPNAWKSTFINSLLWEKVSITSHIPQTTRKRVLAIFNDEESQIIFFDTPWIHESNKLFNEQINNVAIDSLKEADVILYFIDTSRESGVEEEFVKNLVEKTEKPLIRVYTKLDLKPKIEFEVDKNIAKISSITKEGFDDLIKKIKDNLEENTLLFPTDIYTKQDMFFRISEIIREKVFLHTKEELPHSIYVWVEEIDDLNKDEHSKDLLKIVAYVYTETESQKYIVVWKAGSLITQIWKEARIELENIFEKKVFLALKVKTKKDWRKNEHLVKSLLK